MSSYLLGPRLTAGEPVRGAFIYVIRGSHNLVKIGVTTSPMARLAQLHTGSAFMLEYEAIALVTNGSAYAVEKRAHDALDLYRCNGEWFDVPPDVAIAAIRKEAAYLGAVLTPTTQKEAARAFAAAAREPQMVKFVLIMIFRTLLYSALLFVIASVALIFQDDQSGWLSRNFTGVSAAIPLVAIAAAWFDMKHRLRAM